MRRKGSHRGRLLTALRQGLGLSFWAALSPFLCGLLAAAEIGDYSIQTWQTGEGLPQDSVTSIVQTPDGYLWLATFNGLARFDGARFTVFDEGNTPALQNSRLVRLDLDHDGQLWIISEDGSLTRLANGSFKSFTASSGVPPRGARAIIRGPQRRLLLVAREEGIYELQGEQWVRNSRWAWLQPGGVSLHTDKKDRLWAWRKSSGAFGRVLDQQFVPLKAEDGSTDLRIRGIASRHAGGFWLVCSNRVCLAEPKQEESDATLVASSLAVTPTGWILPESARNLTGLVEDLEGNLWLATWGHGVFCFSSSGTCRRLGVNEGLSHEVVRALWLDREGSLWVGTDGGGLNHLRRRLVTMYDERHGLGANVVMSMLQDRVDPEQLWVGLNSGGLGSLRAGRFTPLLAEPLLSTNSLIYGLFQTRQGDLWIGTYSRGVLRFAGGKVTALAEGPEWEGRPLRTALEDRNGSIWAGGAGGLLEWQGAAFTNHNAELGWSNTVVSALAEDRAGNLFVGSFGRGLSRRRDGQWTHYQEKDGLPDNHIASLYIDRQDRVWIGTFNRGLSLFQNGHFNNLDATGGLPDNAIGGIVEDSQGNLWLGCNRGIFRIPAEQAKEYAGGRCQQVTGSTFGLSEGLSTLECSAACAARNGKLWFATAKGLAAIDPAGLRLNTFAPTVIIEEVLIDGPTWPQNPQANGSYRSPSHQRGGVRTQAQARILASSPAPPGSSASYQEGLRPKIVVPPRQARVEFHFTGLSFLAPEKVRFRYRLEKFDDTWIDNGIQRAAYYTRLPAGRYRFRVTACNNDGIWNEQGAELDVVVLPPWWMTWWAEGLAVLGTAALAFWIVETRLRRAKREHAMQSAFSRRLIQAQEEERKRIAAELHDSLGQDLLVIKNRALLGLKDGAAAPQATEQLTEISRLASDSLGEVRQISHDLRPYQLDRLGLTKALQAMITSVSTASGVRCVAQLESLDGLLGEPLEIHCYRIVQELLNNVLKHSQASEARVTATVRNRRICIVFEDDGCGFDSAAAREQPRGAGLTDITERVYILGGTLRCDSERARGTRWTIEIPVADAAREGRSARASAPLKVP